MLPYPPNAVQCCPMCPVRCGFVPITPTSIREVKKGPWPTITPMPPKIPRSSMHVHMLSWSFPFRSVHSPERDRSHPSLMFLNTSFSPVLGRLRTEVLFESGTCRAAYRPTSPCGSFRSCRHVQRRPTPLMRPGLGSASDIVGGPGFAPPPTLASTC